MESENFKFELGDLVRIVCSGEKGCVMARAQHLHGADKYLVRYASANGCAVEQWWCVSALVFA